MREGDTVQLLILAVLEESNAHGYQIAREIERRSGSDALAPEGRLYPALHALEKQGFLTSDWVEGEPRRRVYAISEKGRGRLAANRKAWWEKASAVSRVLGGEQS